MTWTHGQRPPEGWQQVCAQGIQAPTLPWMGMENPCNACPEKLFSCIKKENKGIRGNKEMENRKKKENK